MTDTHLALAVVFDIPDGQDYRSSFPAIFSGVKAGTPDCLYYGLAVCGNKVICREGYKDGAALLQHTKEVPSELATIITNIGPDRVKILCSGPAGELAKVRPHMEGGLPIQFVTLDTGAMVLNNFPTGCEDKHVTILPQFEVPQEKLEEFKKGFQKFYQATKAGSGAAGCLYYGFGICGSTVYCREGYKDAEAALLHGVDVREMLEEPLKIVGPAGFKLNVVGPKSELEKLKPKLAPKGAIFWELDSGSFWM